MSLLYYAPKYNECLSDARLLMHRVFSFYALDNMLNDWWFLCVHACDEYGERHIWERNMKIRVEHIFMFHCCLAPYPWACIFSWHQSGRLCSSRRISGQFLMWSQWGVRPRPIWRNIPMRPLHTGGFLWRGEMDRWGPYPNEPGARQGQLVVKELEVGGFVIPSIGILGKCGGVLLRRTWS